MTRDMNITKMNKINTHMEQMPKFVKKIEVDFCYHQI